MENTGKNGKEQGRNALPEEVSNMKNRGYEYEMSIPRMDQDGTGIRIDNLNLSSSSGVITGNTVSICGVMLHAITMKREIGPGQTITKFARYSV